MCLCCVVTQVSFSDLVECGLICSELCPRCLSVLLGGTLPVGAAGRPHFVESC